MLDNCGMAPLGWKALLAGTKDTGESRSPDDGDGDGGYGRIEWYFDAGVTQ